MIIRFKETDTTRRLKNLIKLQKKIEEEQYILWDKAITVEKITVEALAKYLGIPRTTAHNRYGNGARSKARRKRRDRLNGI